MALPIKLLPLIAATLLTALLSAKARAAQNDIRSNVPISSVPWAEDCAFLELYRRHEPAEVNGIAPAEDVVCFAIKPNSGSEITIRVEKGRNVIFTVLDLVDAVDEYSFRANGYGYFIRVGQLMRSVTDEPFTITIDGGQAEGAKPPPTPEASADMREKVMRFVSAGDGNLEVNRRPNDVIIDPADLNGDGVPEALVMLRNRVDCGASACGAYALDTAGTDARSIGAFLGETLSAAPESTGGWRDVLLDGTRFIFDGEQYVRAGSGSPQAGNGARTSTPWSFSGGRQQEAGSATGFAADGKTQLTLGCNRRLGPAVLGSLSGYDGTALSRVDDESERLVLEIVDGGGNARRFEGRINYFEPDTAWAVRDFPAAMLDRFARGSRMRMLNGQGEEVAEFGLKGTAKARARMKDACGF